MAVASRLPAGSRPLDLPRYSIVDCVRVLCVCACMKMVVVLVAGKRSRGAPIGGPKRARSKAPDELAEIADVDADSDEVALHMHTATLVLFVALMDGLLVLADASHCQKAAAAPTPCADQDDD